MINQKVARIVLFVFSLSLLINFFTLVSYAAAGEPRLAFELSDEIEKGENGVQVILTVKAYDVRLNGLNLTLGFDNSKVQLANKSSNAVTETFGAVSTMIGRYAENQETYEMEGWYTPVLMEAKNKRAEGWGSVFFTFYADPQSKGKLNGVEDDGFVTAGGNGLEIIQFHFKKIGTIDENTFKILPASHPAGNEYNETGLSIATENEVFLTDPTVYAVLPFQDETPTPTVDKTALAAKIAEAEDLLEAAEVGTEPGQYPEAAYNTFEAAINAAKAVNDNEDATQEEVDAAVEALEDAIAAFEASVIGELPVNKDALAAKIVEAEDLLEAAEVGTAPGQYPEEAYNTFEAAINAAKAVNDNEDATQAEVDNAVAALEDAIEEFEDAKIPVEEPSDMPFEIINVTREGIGDAIVTATIKRKDSSYTGNYVVVIQLMKDNEPIVYVSQEIKNPENEEMVAYTFNAQYTVQINVYSKMPTFDENGQLDLGQVLAVKVVK